MKRRIVLASRLACTVLATAALGPAVSAARALPGAPQGGEDLSRALEGIRAKAGAPGLVAMALQDGEILAWGGAGVRALGSPAPLTIHDPVHLGSCAKAMTATLAARLVEDGLLAWDAPLASVLPEFGAAIDESYHDVTLLELLRHQGGIAERRRPEVALLHALMERMEGSPASVRREILTKVLSLPRSPSAEGTFDYSNFGYMTVGLLLEGVTGVPWEELIVERLFRPLGLETAGVGSPAGTEVPVGHLPGEDGLRALAPGPAGPLPDAMGPAGLVHMNLADWGRFVAEHMAGHRDEDGFLHAATIRLLHDDPGGTGYAAGWGLQHHTWSWGEGTVLAHNGSDNSWFSVVFALPEWDLTVLAAANCGGSAGEGATFEARQLLLKTLGYRD